MVSIDINLYTSRRDGNNALRLLFVAVVLDINLFTSRGDGNFIIRFLSAIFSISDINL